MQSYCERTPAIECYLKRKVACYLTKHTNTKIKVHVDFGLRRAGHFFELNPLAWE